ncbi:hypothetical protein M5D96_012330 [Drosophila gunungcola]|uniref:Uncharacterized protein n=1 Tax=Drosophila gunungcola TaxID=103775 RepID=A0A9Q0BJK8_9MUSC|nr:hypothetical protein M5D96_012330 [Drosophila gunungcola]
MIIQRLQNVKLVPYELAGCGTGGTRSAAWALMIHICK